MPTSAYQNIIYTELDQHNHEFTDPSSFLSNPNSPCDDSSRSFGVDETSEASRATLQYISEILMEEELENRPCMLQDCLALQAAERSLEDVLIQEYPPLTNPLLASSIQQNSENSDNFINHGSISFTAATNWDDGSGSISFQNDHNDSGKGRRKTDRHWEDGSYLEEGRINKLSANSAFYADESEPPDMLDKVLLFHHQNPKSDSCSSLQLKKGRGGSKDKRTEKKKKDDNSDVVDFQSLLTQCAKSVASYDRTANDLLKQIRQHSSPYGDGNQRVAHYLANGLEQRLAAAIPAFNPLCLNKMSAADILKAYQTYIKACPFMLMSNIIANKTILKLAGKATRLHIIDFGILYGYQWPSLIQSLAKRPSGPPMLRITGIEFPQSGFRPSESLEETGDRLAKY